MLMVFMVMTLINKLQFYDHQILCTNDFLTFIYGQNRLLKQPTLIQCLHFQKNNKYKYSEK